jgi:hypothetical protein
LKGEEGGLMKEGGERSRQLLKGCIRLNAGCRRGREKSQHYNTTRSTISSCQLLSPLFSLLISHLERRYAELVEAPLALGIRTRFRHSGNAIPEMRIERRGRREEESKEKKEVSSKLA